MIGNQAFRPGGRPVSLMASTLSPLTGAQCSTSGGGEIAYLFTNLGNADAVIGYGPDSGTANGNAVVPLIGTPGQPASVPVMARTQVCYTLAPNQFFFGSTPAGNAEIWIQPGEGA